MNPQHPAAQSASLVQAPVMNCVPAATVVEVEAGAAGAATAGVAAAVVAPPATAPVNPRAIAALALGDASPKPQPPSRSCAMTGPAHFPLLKPQHPAAQSASLVQAPVMN